MSLPVHWIEKIFTKLTVAYGNEFLNRWKGIPIHEVKEDWAECLGGYKDAGHAIKFALENLPDAKAPTAQEFRAICRRAPAPVLLALPEPKADPERVKSELAKLAILKRGFGDARKMAA